MNDCIFQSEKMAEEMSGLVKEENEEEEETADDKNGTDLFGNVTVPFSFL